MVDLQLPQVPHYECAVVAAEPEPQVREFKEKTVERLEESDGEGGGGFKRRRVPAGPKRNMRQRLEEED